MKLFCVHSCLFILFFSSQNKKAESTNCGDSILFGQGLCFVFSSIAVEMKLFVVTSPFDIENTGEVCP